MKKSTLRTIAFAKSCEDFAIVKTIDEKVYVDGPRDRQYTNEARARHDGSEVEIWKDEEDIRSFNGSKDYDATKRQIRVCGGSYLIVEGWYGGDCRFVSLETFRIRVTPQCDSKTLMKVLELTDEDLISAERERKELLIKNAEEAKKAKASKRAFAKETRKILRAGGLEETTISRVMREAGPALAREATLWALEIINEDTDGGYNQVEWGSPTYDLALIVIAGALHRSPGGYERTANAIEASGLSPLPVCGAARQQRALRAARSILLSKEVAQGGGDYYSALSVVPQG